MPPEKVHAVECDVLAPCALGGVITDATVPELHCRVVCGAANNQLGSDAMAAELQRRDIVYVPDFVANAGGVINIAVELEGYDPELARERVAAIRATTSALLTRARSESVTSLDAAMALAFDRIDSVSRLSRIRTTRVRRTR